MGSDGQQAGTGGAVWGRVWSGKRHAAVPAPDGAELGWGCTTVTGCSGAKATPCHLPGDSRYPAHLAELDDAAAGDACKVCARKYGPPQAVAGVPQ